VGELELDAAGLPLVLSGLGRRSPGLPCSLLPLDQVDALAGLGSFRGGWPAGPRTSRALARCRSNTPLARAYAGACAPPLRPGRPRLPPRVAPVALGLRAPAVAAPPQGLALPPGAAPLALPLVCCRACCRACGGPW